MRVNHTFYRTIWPDSAYQYVEIIDQTKLPFAFVVAKINTYAQMLEAIRTMQVRGAPLIGVAGAYAIALAMNDNRTDDQLLQVIQQCVACRPTAVNLAWAARRMQTHLQALPVEARRQAAWKEAAKMADEDVVQNQQIARHGLALIDRVYNNKTIHVLTHCNAGWLATVDHGTALAPIYAAHDAGLPIHVWVDETRPRNQGASLTAWELTQHGVPHTVIADNTGGHLMQQGLVDMVIVGADRVTQNGDVCNKIGTYLKALAAHDNGIPFYAAVPSPTIDWQIDSTEIEIEARNADEVATISGLGADGTLQTVRVIPENSTAFNPAFDITPARLVTGIITEKGVYAPQHLKGASS